MKEIYNRESVHSGPSPNTRNGWRFSLALLFGMFLSIASFAQTAYSESFDGATFVPSGWTNLLTSGTNTWTRVTTGTFPTTSPHSGAGFAKFNCFSADGGVRSLVSPVIDLTNRAGVATNISFWMYRDDGYNTDEDKVEVYYNTASNLTGATLLGTVNRAIGLAPTEAANGWYKYTYAVPAGFSSSTNHLILKGTSAYGNNIYIDDVAWEGFPPAIPPVCAISHAPLDAATGVVRNATLTWANGGGNPTSYDVYFGTSTNPALVGNQAGTSYTPALLASNTQYFWKIVPKNVHGSATGCLERSFTTGTGFSYCAVSTTNAGDYTSAFSTTLANSNVVYTATSNPAGSYSNQTSQSFQVGQGLAFNFSHSYVGGSNGIKIWIDYGNDGTFDVSDEVFYIANSNATKTGSVTIPLATALGTYRMRVRSDYGTTVVPTACGNASYGTAMDYTLTVIAPPSCLAPTALVSSAVTANTATLSWTASTSTPANGYDIYYSTTNTAPTAGTTPTVNNYTPSPYNATGLTPSSTYYWWVRSDCGDTSTWASGGSFTTTQIAATLPYTQDFSGSNGFSFVNGTQVNKWVSGSAAGNTGNSIYISNDAGVTNAYTNTSTSVVQAYRDIAITAGATIAQFSFDWKAKAESCCDYLRVWLVPTSFVPTAGTQIVAGTGRIQIGANLNNVDTWQTYTNGVLDVSSFAGQTMRLVFEWRNDSSTGPQTPAAVDNISLIIPSCIPPTALASSAVTTNGATLSWTASTSTPSNGYDIYYSTVSTAPLAGTTPSINNHTASPLNATGLANASTYYWWVRSDCGGETSTWASGGSFVTLCDAVTSFPWTENFESLTTPNLPNCWSQNDANADNDKWISYPTYGVSSSNAAGLGTDYNAGNNNDYLILPKMTLTGNQRLKFFVRARSTGEPNDYRVALSTTGNQPADFTNELMPLTVVSSTTMTEIAPIDLSSYSGDVFIAVHVPSGGLDGYFLYVDNFTIEDIPSCLAPTALTASNLGFNSANLSWTSAGSNFDVKYGATGFNVVTEGTLAEDFVSGATLSGLASGTNYQFYVRQDCGNGDLSAWAGPYSFRTYALGDNCSAPIAVTTLPYTTTDNTANYTDNPLIEGSPGASGCAGNTNPYLNGNDVVYAYTAAFTGAIKIDMTPTATYSGIFAYANCADIGVNCIGGAADSGTTLRTFNLNVVNGSTYYFVISTWATPQTTAYTLNISKACPTGVWVGTTSDFNTASNWADNMVPEACTNVTVNVASPMVISSDVTVAKLTLAANALVTVNGTLNVGNITVANGGQLTVANDAAVLQTALATNSGLVTVKRNSTSLFRQDYTLWSSPVGGQKLRSFSPLTLFNRFYSYNTTDNVYFQEIVTPQDVIDKTFNVGQGYLIRMPNLDDTQNPVAGYQEGSAEKIYQGSFKGTLNNGNVSVPLSLTGTKFNLVGNPYASPIKVSTFLTANASQIEGTLYFWRKKNSVVNNVGSGYVAYNALGENQVISGAQNGSTIPSVLTHIQTGQGFFVNAKAGATAVAFSNTMREMASTEFFKSATADYSNEMHRFWLSLSNDNNMVGQTLVGYATEATQGVDSNYDAPYFNDSPLALTSIINNNEYVIQGRALPFADTDVVPLGFKTDTAGSYTIALSNFDGMFADNQDIFLLDKSNNSVHNLKTAGYAFTSPVGVFNDRFEVQYKSTLGTNNPSLASNNILIAVKDQQIKINAGSVTMEKIELIDVAGRVIYTLKGVNATTAIIENVVSSNQMLIVRINTKENGVVTQKIIF